MYPGELLSESVSDHKSPLFLIEVIDEFPKFPKKRMPCSLPCPSIEFLQALSVLELQPMSHFVDRRGISKFLFSEFAMFFRWTNGDSTAFFLNEDYFGVLLPKVMLTGHEDRVMLFLSAFYGLAVLGIELLLARHETQLDISDITRKESLIETGKSRKQIECDIYIVFVETLSSEALSELLNLLLEIHCPTSLFISFIVIFLD
jgi:hypothetical protein